MLCQRCHKREANFHYTQIVNNVQTQFNLCSHCANEMGLSKDFDRTFSLDSMFDSFFSPSLFSGFNTPSSFRIDGEKLYKNEFEHEIDKMFSSFGEEIKNENDKNNNNGTKNVIENLKNSLKKAIETENFEEAAKLRDEIKKLENE